MYCGMYTLRVSRDAKLQELMRVAELHKSLVSMLLHTYDCGCSVLCVLYDALSDLLLLLITLCKNVCAPDSFNHYA